MNVTLPPYLKAGDTIGIAATARWISPDALQTAIETFHSWGLRTKLATNLHTRYFQLAGNDEMRSVELQKLMDDDEVKAIIMARGGYGTVRVIDKLDFTRFLEKPKWICGYSDITVLHERLNRFGVATIHSTMPISFPMATAAAIESLRACLFGQMKTMDWNTESVNDMLPELKSLPMLGGNLSVLYSVLGSHNNLNQQDSILFIEDVDEMLYHVDRMLMGLKRSEFFHRVKAIIVGGMTQMKDNTRAHGFADDNGWGYTAEQSVKRIADELNIPVLTNFPAGHQDNNCAFYLGMPITMKVEKHKVVIEYLS
ncbi:MAG: LD-carboxypeptidase [Flavobacteriales bacterium]